MLPHIPCKQKRNTRNMIWLAGWSNCSSPYTPHTAVPHAVPHVSTHDTAQSQWTKKEIRTAMCAKQCQNWSQATVPPPLLPPLSHFSCMRGFAPHFFMQNPCRSFSVLLHHPGPGP